MNRRALAVATAAALALLPLHAHADPEPSSTLTRLWEAVAGHVRVVELADPPPGVTVNEHHEALLFTGTSREMAAAAYVRCVSQDAITYYRRDLTLHRADFERLLPSWSPARREAHARQVSDETDTHELAHVVHCMTTGDVRTPMSDTVVRAIYRSIGISPSEWKARPVTFPGGDRHDWYCWSGRSSWGGDPVSAAWAEWFACQVTEDAR